MENMPKDYYKILGVSKNSSQEEIKQAFRKLAHKHHPDKAGGDEAKFKEINEAYQILGDEKKRSQFDQFGSAAFDSNGGGAGQGFGGLTFQVFHLVVLRTWVIFLVIYSAVADVVNKNREVKTFKLILNFHFMILFLELKKPSLLQSLHHVRVVVEMVLNRGQA